MRIVKESNEKSKSKRKPFSYHECVHHSPMTKLNQTVHQEMVALEHLQLKRIPTSFMKCKLYLYIELNKIKVQRL